MLENEIKELTKAILILTDKIETLTTGETKTLLNPVSEGSEDSLTPKATKKKAKKKATKKSAKSDEVSHDTVKALAKSQIANGKITRAAAKKLIADFGADKIDDLDEDDLIEVHKAFSELE